MDNENKTETDADLTMRAIFVDVVNLMAKYGGSVIGASVVKEFLEIVRKYRDRYESQ